MVATATLGLPAIGRAKQATALCLCGDRYHNIDYIRTALGKTLVKEAGLSVDFTDELGSLEPGQLSRYKLLIMLRDGMTWPDGYPDNTTYAGYLGAGKPALDSVPPLAPQPAKPHYWITAPQGKAVKEFVRNGGGALLFHNVTYISPHNDDFRDVLGAVTRGHPPIRKFKVRVVNRDHPITRGVSDFVVTDEQHFMEYQKDSKHLLLESVNEDGLAWREFGPSAAAGWAYDYGKGRVCYLAPGHMITALWNPEYEKLQRNAVRWLLRA
jgi:type 1 glutamine amidotransferase